jgi:hypothetical protein
MLLSTALAAIGKFVAPLLPEFVFQLLEFTVSFVVITLLFAMMFKWLPDAHRRTVPGPLRGLRRVSGEASKDKLTWRDRLRKCFEQGLHRPIRIMGPFRQTLALSLGRCDVCSRASRVHPDEPILFSGDPLYSNG